MERLRKSYLFTIDHKINAPRCVNVAVSVAKELVVKESVVKIAVTSHQKNLKKNLKRNQRKLKVKNLMRIILRRRTWTFLTLGILNKEKALSII
jgi:hypothetical protein